MATDIRVPALGESVTEATIGQWFKKVGDTVAADEPVVELETDKVTIEVPAPSAGVLESITANPGDPVNGNGAAVPPAPSAAKLMAEAGLTDADINGSGRRGQILKEDVLAAAAKP